MSDDMITRMLRRAEELDLTPRGLSVKAGLGPTTVRDIVNRPGASPRLATMRKLAAALGTTPEWLSYGGDAGPVAAQPAGGAAARVVRPLYGGVVETDAYRPDPPTANWPEAPPMLALPAVPDLQHMIFDVVGNGMDALRPVPILQGMRVIGISTEAIRHFQPQEDMLLVVERRLDERLRELSIRQVEMRPDGPAFVARSTDPRSAPIEPAKANDGVCTVRIIAVVRRATFEV